MDKAKDTRKAKDTGKVKDTGKAKDTRKAKGKPAFPAYLELSDSSDNEGEPTVAVVSKKGAAPNAKVRIIYPPI